MIWWFKLLSLTIIFVLWWISSQTNTLIHLYLFFSCPHSVQEYLCFFVIFCPRSPGPEQKTSSLLPFKPERSKKKKKPAKSSRSQWTECMLFYSLGYNDVMLSEDEKMSSMSTEGLNPVLHYSELESLLRRWRDGFADCTHASSPCGFHMKTRRPSCITFKICWKNYKKRFFPFF